MSKADKMRGQLAKIQQDREDFEKQKKELEEEMHRGRQNMGKIKKGLREGGIVNEQILVSESVTEPDTPNQSRKPSKTPNPKMVKITTVDSNKDPNAFAKESDKIPLPSPFSPDKGQPFLTSIIPTGPRISEWCFTGDINSAPPIVKARELYENVRLLGRGSFGEVNLVKNVEDNKLFAIKTIFCAKDVDMGPVLHEVKFLRLSRHPCIIDIHDCFLMTNPRVMHIVMHYCESGSIASFISNAKKNKSSISETQIIKWILQLALALQFMHDVNHTLHRDIKPMNIMLTEGGEIIKLADFGLALNMDECSVSESFAEAGTPYYTAPEMIKGENYSYPADCWSFGIILHQLMTLERPFEGSSTAALVKAVLTDEPPALPMHYSEDLRAISAGLLIKDPIDRVTMAQLLSDPFMHGKASSFPSSYRPKTLEERIRRQHVKLLEHQMESLQRSAKSIVQSVKSNSKLTPPPLEPHNSTPTMTMEGLTPIQPVELPKIDESSLKSGEKAVNAILDKIGEVESNRSRQRLLMQSFASVSDDEESGKFGSGKNLFGTSGKEDGLSSKLAPIVNPNETELSNSKLSAEESSSQQSYGEDLHGPIISFFSSNVIKMRSSSYHGHVNSDEERDAMVTPYGPKCETPPGFDEGNEDEVVSPMRIDDVIQKVDLFAKESNGETPDGIGFSTRSGKQRFSDKSLASPGGSAESPNLDSSPMASTRPASIAFTNSDRSMTSEESNSQHSLYSPTRQQTALNMDVIHEEGVDDLNASIKATNGVDNHHTSAKLEIAVVVESVQSERLDGASPMKVPTLDIDMNAEIVPGSEPLLTPLGGRKGKAIASAIEADSYYEAKLNE